MIPIPQLEQLVQRREENKKRMMDEFKKEKPKTKDEEKLIELHIKLLGGFTG